MKSLSELKGKLEVKDVYEVVVGDYKLEFPLKSLPANYGDELESLFPMPEPRKKPNKKTHKFEPDYEDPEWKEEKKKMNRLRTYATVALALAGPIRVSERSTSKTKEWKEPEEFAVDGADVYAQVDQLLDTKIGMGYWAAIAEHIQTISGIDMEKFRSFVSEAGRGGTEDF